MSLPNYTPLTDEEFAELDRLQFRMITDLPYTLADQARYQELYRRAFGEASEIARKANNEQGVGE